LLETVSVRTNFTKIDDCRETGARLCTMHRTMYS